MKQQKLSYRLFGRFSKQYNQFLRLFGYEQSVRFFVSQIPLEEAAPLHILDVGCGTGVYTKALAKRFPNAQIVAFDMNADMVAQLESDMATEFPDIVCAVSTHDITQPLLAYPQAPFDLIIASGVLEYAPLTETVAMLAQQLKSDGLFYYSPLRDSAYGRLIGFIYQCIPHTETATIAAFAAAGLTPTLARRLSLFHPASFKDMRIFQKKRAQ